MTLEDIKEDICRRIDKFEVNEFILNKKDINNIPNINELFEYLFGLYLNEHKLSEIVSERFKSQVLTIDKIEEWFGEDFLSKKHVYYYGKHTVYGGYKNIFALGSSQIEVASDALVFGFHKSNIKLCEKSKLYSNDDCVFIGKHNSQVYIMFDSNSCGTLFNNSFCENHSNNAIIETHDNSCVETFNHAHVSAFDNSHITCYDYSRVDSYHGNVHIKLNDYSSAYCCEPNVHLLCEDNSIAYIFNVNDNKYQCGNCECNSSFELRNDSIINVYTKTNAIKATDHAVIRDYTDMHANPFDYSFVLWMNKMRAWYNAHDEDAQLTFLTKE